MGYTHYYTPKESTSKKFEEFSTRCKKLYEALPEKSGTAGGYASDQKIEIRGGDGTGKPEFTKEKVWFNGNSKNGTDHETLGISSKDKNGWNFCKTQRKPYDLLVCAVLIASHDLLGYEVTSDGDLDDWIPAMKFYLDTIYGYDSSENEAISKIMPEFLVEELKVSR